MDVEHVSLIGVSAIGGSRGSIGRGGMSKRLARGWRCARPCAVPQGEQAVVADAVEIPGQDVQQEAPDELVWVRSRMVFQRPGPSMR